MMIRPARTTIQEYNSPSYNVINSAVIARRWHERLINLDIYTDAVEKELINARKLNEQYKTQIDALNSTARANDIKLAAVKVQPANSQNEVKCVVGPITTPPNSRSELSRLKYTLKCMQLAVVNNIFGKESNDYVLTMHEFEKLSRLLITQNPDFTDELEPHEYLSYGREIMNDRDCVLMRKIVEVTQKRKKEFENSQEKLGELQTKLDESQAALVKYQAGHDKYARIERKLDALCNSKNIDGEPFELREKYLEEVELCNGLIKDHDIDMKTMRKFIIRNIFEDYEGFIGLDIGSINEYLKDKQIIGPNYPIQNVVPWKRFTDAAHGLFIQQERIENAHLRAAYLVAETAAKAIATDSAQSIEDEINKSI